MVAYATDDAVYFDPREIKPDRCMICARVSQRISPRTVAALSGAGYGRYRVTSLRNVLTLCEPCDRRWSVQSTLGMAVVFSPLYLIPLMGYAITKVDWIGPGLFVGTMVGSLIAAFVAWLWARSKLIRPISIDEDGTLGLRNVHPDTRARIVEIGDQRHGRTTP